MTAAATALQKSDIESNRRQAASRGSSAEQTSSPYTAPAGKRRHLSDTQLEEMFEKLDVPDGGRQCIRRMRESLPGRVTASTSYSGKLRFPSLKMAFTMEAEAFNTEMVALTEWDHDHETREFYSQANHRLKITYRSAQSGKKITTSTLADAFRITDDAFIFTECKMESFLETESVRQPARFTRLADGTWCSPPAEEAAAKIGCRYELRSSAVNNWALHENLELLHDFYVANDQGVRLSVPAEVRRRLFERLEGHPYLCAFDLIHVEPRIGADDLYALLVAGEIYFPLAVLRLKNQRDALFFRTQDEWHAHELYVRSDRPDRRTQGPRPELRLGDIFEWNGVRYEVVNPGKNKLTARLLGDETQLITLPRDKIERLPETELTVLSQQLGSATNQRDERYAAASPADMQEAVWRYQILFDKPEDDNPLRDRCERSRFNWMHAYREAEAQWGNGFLGLLPQRVGNPEAKADPASKKLAEAVIQDDWETVRRKGRLTSYGEYLNRCQEQGLEPLSYSTFCRMVKGRKGFAQSATRIGAKAAYDEEPPYLELTQTTPRHGTHSWHIGHIDHTPLPLQFLTAQEGAFADTVWLTLLTGAHDRKIYAYYLSFDEPSYRSCMMVIRDCVRRHGRFFQYAVVDNASEFDSGYFEKLLSRLYAKKRNRPKGKPRFGSVCERTFGTTQSQFVKVLLGATDIVEKHFREISREVSPREQAVWILDRFDKAFETYVATVYHRNSHAGLDMSPNDASLLSEKDHGARPFRRLPYDEQFIAETCPAPKRDKVKVRPEGVKMNYIWYSGPALHQPGVLGTSVHARYDPWNLGVAFVFLKGKWHEVHSQFRAALEGCTERLMRFAAAAMRVIARQRNQKANIGAMTLAAFLLGVSKDEASALQARNDAEAKPHRDKVGKTDTSRPPSPADRTGSLPGPAPSTAVAVPVHKPPQSQPLKKAPKFELLEDL